MCRAGKKVQMLSEDYSSESKSLKWLMEEGGIYIGTYMDDISRKLSEMKE